MITNQYFDEWLCIERRISQADIDRTSAWGIVKSTLPSMGKGYAVSFWVPLARNEKTPSRVSFFVSAVSCTLPRPPEEGVGSEVKND